MRNWQFVSTRNMAIKSKMKLRSLASFEKKLLSQSLEGCRNGVAFGAQYSTSSEEWSDDATLLTVKDCRLTPELLTNSLKNLVSQHVELRTTINDNLEFDLLTKIKVDDVINIIQFESIKDELVNCHSGAPPYLLRHIFNKDKFMPGSGRPLWSLYVIDESLVIFHGQDTIFDIFSAAEFHKLLLTEINKLIASKTKLEKLDFLLKPGQITETKVHIPKSMYDNPKLHLPAMDPDLFNLQTQSFFKTIYFNAVKKPIDFFNFVGSSNNNLKITGLKQSSYFESFDLNSSLCGTTVFGSVSNARFQYLNSLVKKEEISFRSFICGITMLCLKPMVKHYNGAITFSMPINLRNEVDDSRNFGLFYKDVRVECPLSLINDDNVPKDVKSSSPEDAEQLLEYQFKQITIYVSNILEQSSKRFAKTGFNDNDIRRMKLENDVDRGVDSKIIQIYDASEVFLGVEPDKVNQQSFSITSSNFTKSLSLTDLMSVSYTYCKGNGLNICIHYPDGYNMESFVECFQTFIE